MSGARSHANHRLYLARILLESGADVGVTTANGETPLHLAGQARHPCTLSVDARGRQSFRSRRLPGPGPGLLTALIG